MSEEEAEYLLLCTFAPFFAEVNAPVGYCFGVATGEVVAVPGGAEALEFGNPRP
jgi:hypothetical protein